jgi:hypothetical protein
VGEGGGPADVFPGLGGAHLVRSGGSGGGGHGVPERGSARRSVDGRTNLVQSGGGFGGRLRVPGLRCPLGPDILTNAFSGAGPLDLPVSGPSGTRSSWTRPVSLWIGGWCGRETRLVR